MQKIDCADYLPVRALVLALAGVAAANCSANSRGSSPGGSAGSGGFTSAGGVSGVNGVGGSGGEGAGLVIDGATPDEPACAPCSADLKNVIDCDGNVQKECGANEACAGGVCIGDPCEAARQAKSSYGCDYWTLNLEAGISGYCYAVFVANTWSVPAKISVERAGQIFTTSQFARIPSGQGPQLKYGPYSDAAGLPPGEVAILFLAAFGGKCPGDNPTALPVDTAIVGTGRGQAFRITTDVPIVAYQIYPYAGPSAFETSATLLLPISAWDVNYVAISAYAKIPGLPYPPSIDMVAAEDGTEVEISPVAAIKGGPGVPGTGKGQPIKYTLARGEYLQLTQDEELTGSAILASKPIGVFGGHTLMNVPVGKGAADAAQQQIPPVRAMGHEYVAVRYRSRNGLEESVPWRVVGAVDGTTLSYMPYTPQGAPTTLAQGQAVEFWSPGPFVITSQDADHPFYLSGYMTGWEQAFPGFVPAAGDPEWVNVVPAAQYLSSYVFFTDPTYPETNLVVVRKKDKNGFFADVELDCAGFLTGWQSVGDYEYTRADLVIKDFQNVGACANGRRVMKSTRPFGLTVWGWGIAASYAYPGGAAVQSINQVVVPPTPR